MLADIGFISEDQSYLKEPISWKEAIQKILGATSSSERDLKWANASKAKFKDTEEKERIVSGLRWVTILPDEKITSRGNPLDTLCAILEKKMQFWKDERDFVMRQHKFEIGHKDGGKQTETSTLIKYGDPKGYSAMAKLVGVPSGVAVHGTISKNGILTSMTSKIDNPSMAELKTYGITIVEKNYILDGE